MICISAILALALGTAVELAQAMTGRNGDFWDVVRDAGGASSIALLLAALDPASSGFPRAALAGVAAATLVAFAVPLFQALDDEARARAQFPVLASFETRSELSRFHFGNGTQYRIVRMPDAKGGTESAIQLHLPAGRYPGLVLSHFPGDWQGMRALQLRITNPEPTPLDITVRIDDADYDYRLDLEDRYNRSFTLSPGPNRIEIPLSDVAAAPRDRRFDLGHVQSLLLYAVDLAQPRNVILGPITLLP